MICTVVRVRRVVLRAVRCRVDGFTYQLVGRVELLSKMYCVIHCHLAWLPRYHLQHARS